ncbi:YidB family protein [Neorhizobium alkalisoli]|uniref:YidB family protein n=1 Tax=Neorhizobium alkalisoli TaxID=528178 RepID=UPI000CF91B9F|nr:YidB family protein [Neorhizobium alkalisoli]
MQRGPLKALLAVLAVAGYQNRDKIADILKNITEGRQAVPPGGTEGTAASQPSGGLNDVLGKLSSGGLGSILAGGGVGSLLNGGLNDLLDQFRETGHDQKADSWVRTGANDPINDTELQEALGPDVVRDVAAKTGLSEEEVLRRLSRELPDAVDGLTPDGKVPPAQGTV